MEPRKEESSDSFHGSLEDTEEMTSKDIHMLNHMKKVTKRSQTKIILDAEKSQNKKKMAKGKEAAGKIKLSKLSSSDHDSEEISDCNENIEENNNLEVKKVRASPYRGGHYETEPKPTRVFDFRIIDHCDVDGVLIHDNNKPLVRNSVYRGAPKIDEAKYQEEESTPIPKAKFIIDETIEYVKDSSSENFTEQVLGSILETNASEVMYFQNPEGDKKEDSEEFLVTGSTNDSPMLKKQSISTGEIENDYQLSKMVVVTKSQNNSGTSGKKNFMDSEDDYLNNNNEEYVILASPGCEVIKTWRVKNMADHKWPKEPYLKPQKSWVSCELPVLRRLLSGEEMEISVRIFIDEEALDGSVIHYTFFVCTKKYQNIGEALNVTVKVDKKKFNDRIKAKREREAYMKEISVKQFNKMFTHKPKH
ncbi:unnamed protein product [Moneuplotes crassus]|uniref:Uncharacterized protein n=1 Tax=Euplotes crassus TaxID=5936 RepID=A0AAD1U663_EUPCR|nr:unnamed protein product [Moneuplotes crassus]